MFTIPIDYLMLALPLKYWPFLHILINTSIDFIISQLDSSAWYHSGANTHLTSSQSIHLDTFYCFFFYFKLLSIVKPHHCASGMYYLMNSFKATHFDILNCLSWFFKFVFIYWLIYERPNIEHSVHFSWHVITRTNFYIRYFTFSTIAVDSAVFPLFFVKDTEKSLKFSKWRCAQAIE